MSRDRDSSEVRDEYLSSMGSALGEVFYALYNEVTWVHAKWSQYRKLFGTNERRIETLNKTASFLFGIIQDVLWDDILLSISRLTDPEATGKWRNLTIQCLPGLVGECSLRAEVQDAVDRAVRRGERVRGHRDKRLAHKDYQLALKEMGAEQLQGISRSHIEDALEAIRCAMNTVESHYRDSSTFYDYFIASYDADWLLSRLDESVDNTD